MNENQREKRKPRLRFPEFREGRDWREEQLHKIAAPILEKATTEDHQVLTLSGEQGLVPQTEYFGKIIAGNNKERYIKVVRNDFVYNDRTTKVSKYGSIKRLSKCESGVVSPIYKCFRFDSGENPSFWEFYFESGSHEAQLHRLINEGARTGRFNISIDQFLSTYVSLPEPPEQQRIADCLCSIDDLIAAEARKLSALRAHRSSLMRQLFPSAGEVVPKLRFQTFSGDWKENTLGAISDRISSGRDRSDSDGSYQLYGSTGVIGKTSSDSYSGEFILVARVGANAGFLTKATGKFGVTDNTLVVHLKKHVSLDFVFFYLDNVRLNKLIFGSGQPLITGGQLRELPVYLPGDPEQQRIASCLSSLDALIAAQSQKIEALAIHERGLMQQLFPVLKEMQE